MNISIKTDKKCGGKDKDSRRIFVTALFSPICVKLPQRVPTAFHRYKIDCENEWLGYLISNDIFV